MTNQSSEYFEGVMNGDDGREAELSEVNLNGG